MSHPFLRLLVTEPKLLADHAEAYADLIARDAGAWHRVLIDRFIRQVVIGVSLILSISFAGIAVMLWAVTAVSHWALFVVPALPLIVAAAVWILPRHNGGSFATLRAQLAADATMLREVP